MKHLVILLVAFTFFLVSCGGSTTDPDPPSNPVLAEETIGAAGGTLEIDGFTLTVPAGAFSTDQDLELRLSSEDEIPEMEGRSELYHLSGLPAVLDQALEVSFESDYAGEGQPYLGLGSEGFAKPSGEGTFVWDILDATRQRGRVTGSIPPYDTQQRADTDTEICCFHSRHHDSSAGHFKILYHPLYAPNMPALAEYFEEAYTKFLGMNWSYADRTAWPVKVYITPLGPDIDGLTYGSIFGDNYGTIAINTRITGDLALLRTTAGHEFFHLVQAFYDPRWSYSKAKWASAHYWLDEAASTWAEELFTDDPDSYLPPTLQQNVMEPFEGLQAGGNREASHGYGCAGVVKYLVGLDGSSALLEAYQAIDAEEHAIRALEMGSDNAFTDIWNNLMVDYYSGELYGETSTAYMSAFYHDDWFVEEVDDTLKTFSGGIPALGAELYKIKLDYPQMDEGVSAEFTRIGPDPGYVNVFKYTAQGGLELLGLGESSVTVPELKELNDENALLYVLVTNCRDEAPDYLASSSIQTEVRILPGTPILDALKRPDRVYYYMSAAGAVNHHFVYDDPDTTYTFDDHNFPSMGGNSVPGDIYTDLCPPLEVNGTHIYGEVDYNDWHWEIDGTLSADGQRITYVEGAGEMVMDVEVDGEVVGEWRVTLIIALRNLDLLYEVIENESCQLIWASQDLSSLESIYYESSYPTWEWEGGEIVMTGGATTTYTGSDWSSGQLLSFSFRQSAP